MVEVNQTNEYITFTLGEGEYAIEVTSIESILEYTKLTKLPGTDETVKGVLNLRGKALPVVDIRTILNIEEKEITNNTSIIVMLIKSGDKIITIGGLVDSVKEVIEITPEMVQGAPKVGTRIKGDFISGIAKHKEHFIIILDINKVISEEQTAIAEDGNLLLPDDVKDELPISGTEFEHGSNDVLEVL
ncbi:MAG: chemotaxis protein CheW [Spirochaetaceae bacterium]|nr:chemotaxis protein CheW [Spirochaetaceae bacterium]